jgi:hypothetical protein
LAAAGRAVRRQHGIFSSPCYGVFSFNSGLFYRRRLLPQRLLRAARENAGKAAALDVF